MTVDEIAENWRTAELSAETEEEFYTELHNPKTNARELLDDQCFVRPDFTDAQWEEVLERLRVLFPLVPKIGDDDVDDDSDSEENPCDRCKLILVPHRTVATEHGTYCKSCWEDHVDVADSDDEEEVCDGCGKEGELGDVEGKCLCEACVNDLNENTVYPDGYVPDEPNVYVLKSCA
jgi:hypothetical protein